MTKQGSSYQRLSLVLEQMWSAADSALDEDSDGSESVMERLSRRMGSLFSYDRQDRGTQTAKDPLTLETEKLAFDIVFFVLGRRPSKASDETTQCLRQSVVKMLDKHSIVFNGMVTRLSIDRDCDLHAGFQELSNELFTNNEVQPKTQIRLKLLPHTTTIEGFMG